MFKIKQGIAITLFVAFQLTGLAQRFWYRRIDGFGSNTEVRRF